MSSTSFTPKLTTTNMTSYLKIAFGGEIDNELAYFIMFFNNEYCINKVTYHKSGFSETFYKIKQSIHDMDPFSGDKALFDLIFLEKQDGVFVLCHNGFHLMEHCFDNNAKEDSETRKQLYYYTFLLKHMCNDEPDPKLWPEVINLYNRCSGKQDTKQSSLFAKFLSWFY